MLRKAPKAFILFGPSGSGKTYIKNYLVKKGIKPLKLHTTREKRRNEENEEYYFVRLNEFDKMEKEGKFVLTIKIDPTWKYGLLCEEVKKYKDDNIVIDFINKEPALQFYEEIVKTHKPFLCFFEIPLKERIQIFKDRNMSEYDIKKRIEREDRYEHLDILTRNKSFLFTDFSTNIEKIERLLAL